MSGYHKDSYKASSLDAVYRTTNEAMRIAISAERTADATHSRLDTHLKEIAEMRSEVERLNEVIKGLSDRMDAMREWAKTIPKKKETA
jgi:prefoldin subunit 5